MKGVKQKRMYFSDVTKFGLPIDYYILDLEFGSTRAVTSQQDVPLEIALTQYHKGQQKHKAFLKYCYDPKYDDHTILRGLRHSNLPFQKYIEQGNFDIVIKEFLDYFDPALPVGGWNVKGDLNVLNYYINYHRNTNPLLNARVNYFNVDSYMRSLSGLTGIKLEQAGRIYGYDTSKMHHALNDVRLTHQVYETVRKISETNPQIRDQFKSNNLVSCDLTQTLPKPDNKKDSKDKKDDNTSKVNFDLSLDPNNIINSNKIKKVKPEVSIKALNKHVLNTPARRVRSKKQLNYTFVGINNSELADNKKNIMASLALCLHKTLVCRDSMKHIDFAVYVNDVKSWQTTLKEDSFTPKENDALAKAIPVLSLQDLQAISSFDVTKITGNTTIHL